MERESSLRTAWSDEALSILRFNTVVLPTDEYETFVLNFPATNCSKPWGLYGDFFLSLQYYRDGKRELEIESYHTTEAGHLRVPINQILDFMSSSERGLLLIDFHHTKSIPVDLYTSHVHKKTGSYLAYPSNAYVGDELFPGWHNDELENAVFWPGWVPDPGTEVSILLINPYKTSCMNQVSLYLPSGQRRQTEAIKLKPFSYKILPIEEMFPGASNEVMENQGAASVCVAGQYKVSGNIMIKHRETGLITTIDHLHRFCIR